MMNRNNAKTIYLNDISVGSIEFLHLAFFFLADAQVFVSSSTDEFDIVEFQMELFKCKVCGKETENKEEIMNHIQNHYPDQEKSVEQLTNLFECQLILNKKQILA